MATSSSMKTSVTVNLYGAQAGGIWPHYKVIVDGVTIGSGYASTTKVKPYTFETTLAADQPHHILVQYDNDGQAAGRNRDLFVKSIEVNGHTISSTDPHVTYDRGAIDGIKTVAGQTKMGVNGALVFDLGADLFHPQTSHLARGMWAWNTSDILGDKSAASSFVQAAKAAGVTDVYLYLKAGDYTAEQGALANLNQQLAHAGIASWGLEGWRGYFSDSYGPKQLYAAADALVGFNARVAADARFAGFHSDMEPQDGQGEGRSLFHNGLADSQLTTAQAADRATLMKDWLTIQSTLNSKMDAAHLLFGASMPSWTDDYYGEEVQVTWSGVRQGVMKHMMNLVDDYVVMSYNTNPANAANRVVGEVTWADQLASHPRVFAAVETHAGVGVGVSYGDDPAKNSKFAVLADMDAIADDLSQHSSFAGVSIHDWVGWHGLQDH